MTFQHKRKFNIHCFLGNHDYIVYETALKDGFFIACSGCGKVLDTTNAKTYKPIPYSEWEKFNK